MVFRQILRAHKGIVFTCISVSIWATTPVAAELLLNRTRVFELLLFNSFFSMLFFLSVSAKRGKLPLLRQHSRKDYFNFFLFGLLGVYLSYLGLFVAIKFMPSQKAFMINYTWPLMMVVLAAIFLKERMTLTKSIGVSLSFIGVVVVVSGGNFSNLSFSIPGTVVSLLGALAYAIYSVLSKRVHYNQTVAATAMSISFFALSLVSYAIFSVVAMVRWGYKFPDIGISRLAGYAFMGIFPNGLGYLFWMHALKHSDITVISNLVYLTPFVSLVLIWLFIGDAILLSSAIGVTIIVAGIFLEKIVSKKIYVPELE